MKRISSLIMFTIATILVLNVSGYGQLVDTKVNYLDDLGGTVCCEAESDVKYWEYWVYFGSHSSCDPDPIYYMGVRQVTKLNGVTQNDSGYLWAGPNDTYVYISGSIIYRESGTNTYSARSYHTFETDYDTWHPQCSVSVGLID